MNAIAVAVFVAFLAITVRAAPLAGNDDLDRAFNKDEALVKAKAVKQCILDNKDKPDAKEQIPQCILTVFSNDVAVAKQKLEAYLKNASEEVTQYFLNAGKEVRAYFESAKGKLLGFANNLKDQVLGWVEQTINGRPAVSSRAFNKDEALAKAKAVKQCILDNKDKPDASDKIPECILAVFSDDVAQAKQKLAAFLKNASEDVTQYFLNAGKEVRAYFENAKGKLLGFAGVVGEKLGDLKDKVFGWIDQTINGRPAVSSRAFNKDEALAKAKAVKQCILDNKDKPDAKEQIPQCILTVFSNDVAVAKQKLEAYLKAASEEVTEYFLNAGKEVRAYFESAKGKLLGFANNVKDQVVSWVEQTIG